MEQTVVKSRLRPRRIIERPRLTQLLTESESRVMMLVAPAGYGKTTLAREWLRDRKHAWYQTTQSSSDVAALALGLAEAGACIVPDVGARLRGRLKTVSDAGAEAESLATDLAADLSEWPGDTTLVVDDYHLLAENAAAEAFFHWNEIDGKEQSFLRKAHKIGVHPLVEAAEGGCSEAGATMS